MRHRIGLALAVGMLAELFFAAAWGYLRLLRLPPLGTQLTGLPADGGSLFSDHRELTALLALTASGVLVGILIAVPRISPLAAGVPGLVLIGWTVMYLINVRQAVDLIPLRSDAYGSGFEAMLINGRLAEAGFAMIIPMFIPARWRRVTAAGVPVGLPSATETESLPTEPVTIVPAGTGPVPAFSGPAPVTRLERVASPGVPPAGESLWQQAAAAAETDSDPGPGPGGR
jgi:hypothetical protein